MIEIHTSASQALSKSEILKIANFLQWYSAEIKQFTYAPVCTCTHTRTRIHTHRS